MRRNLLFLLMVAAFVSVPAMAAVSVEETTDAEYLINSGYSESTAEAVFVSKNRVNGKPAEPLYEKSHNKCVRALKKLYSYIDPAQESDMSIYHDIKDYPTYSDL